VGINSKFQENEVNDTVTSERKLDSDDGGGGGSGDGWGKGGGGG
jgi:hypothetical protein